MSLSVGRMLPSLPGAVRRDLKRPTCSPGRGIPFPENPRAPRSSTNLQQKQSSGFDPTRKRPPGAGPSGEGREGEAKMEPLMGGGEA